MTWFFYDNSHKVLYFAKNVLIIGGGNIGLNLAKMLESNFEDVRIKIIEKDKKRAEEIANELSSSIVINGDALDEEIKQIVGDIV